MEGIKGLILEEDFFWGCVCLFLELLVLGAQDPIFLLSQNRRINNYNFAIHSNYHTNQGNEKILGNSVVFF